MAKFTLPDLDYDYDALEPHIDARTMEIHHTKHHQGYINKFNKAVDGTKFADLSPSDVLRQLDEVPEDIQTTVRQNGGGTVNHALFWEVMSPDGGGNPEGDLAAAIDDAFGSFDDFKETFSNNASGRFGSGWSWLVVDDDSGNLAAYSTANQNSPFLQGHTPILGLDVWEHAYYLHYQNRRGDYVENWWNLVNWDAVSEHFGNAT
jgi:Fe-Mn family superoxide dismutase